MEKTPYGGHFVAIDSEGINIGEVITEGGSRYRDQRTCLWMAGGADGLSNQSLVDLKGLSSERIFDFS